MHLQPGMIIQVFKTEGNCNAVDTVNPFLGALPRQTSMLKHESTRTRLDSKVFWILSLGSGLQHLKFEEIQSWSLRCVFISFFFFQPSPAIWQVLLKFSYFTLTHRWEVHGLEGCTRRGFARKSGEHFPRFPTLVRPLSLRYKAANPVLQWAAPGHRSKKLIKHLRTGISANGTGISAGWTGISAHLFPPFFQSPSINYCLNYSQLCLEHWTPVLWEDS